MQISAKNDQNNRLASSLCGLAPPSGKSWIRHCPHSRHFHSFEIDAKTLRWIISIVTIFITARKRSLGQGKIFRSVCQEFCSQGECLVWGGPGGVSGPGGCLVLGGACSGGVPGPGGCLLWGVPAPRGCAWWRSPGRLLPRAVRILLECILVLFFFAMHFLPF